MNEKKATATRPAAITASKIGRQKSQPVCPWQSGRLGNDIRFARVAPDSVSKAVDEALGLMEVSTRVTRKQGKKMEKAAAKAGLCLKAWLRKARVKDLARSKKKSKKEKSKKK